MEWGEHLPKLLEMEKSTGVTPKALLDRPELNPYTHFIYQCFTDLSRDRRYSESGPLPITLQETVFYVRLFQIDDSYFFWQLIRVLDNIWLAKVTEKQKMKMQQASKKSSPR